MADTFFIKGLNTLPEQVQLNKEDITKLKDDISKIKPNAWEERKFRIIDGEASMDATAYNPITDTNVPVNIQKSFTDKDTYSSSDTINSYSFAFSAKVNSSGSLGNSFVYAVCANPSMTISDISNALSTTSKNAIIFFESDNDSESGPFYLLNINCTSLKAETFSFYNSDLYIDTITANDDKSIHSMLTASAIDNYYLKKTDASGTYLTKTDASNTYLTKTDASNTYVTKQDYEERIDTGDIILTQDGFDKISTMTEDVGTTITLADTADFAEHIQVTNTRELILNVYYNGDPIYRNIHLMPNQTINDYTAVQEDIENWYTGHAILILPSQDYGYFAVSYQYGNYSQLILTLIAHY